MKITQNKNKNDRYQKINAQECDFEAYMIICII